MQSGAGTLELFWRGHAGDAAVRYFTDLAASVVGLQAPLETVARAYLEMADAVGSAGEAIGGLVKGMIDAAIIAGLAAAAGTVTEETGVGAVVGYGVTGIPRSRREERRYRNGHHVSFPSVPPG
ncbi:hypothetical protein AB0J86_05050 [Micromonospora sp. NPDC049559]|uniref:hypothetical protein n=1 Tax=Micromonospora sp. NPDC049559 TaxID=3155923 RepID=UPI003432E876